jgi:glutathione S-transferase
MKLYITPGSPYARMARMVVIEKRLEERVKIVPANTRLTDSPYYAINPSGRVPYLVCDNGFSLEESSLICDYIDRLDGDPVFDLPTGTEAWDARRLEALARSMLDGLSVWGRELHRPPHERSPGIIEHETERARRLADTWESEAAHPLLSGPLNIVHLTLACALGLEARNPDFRWRSGRPRLTDWFFRIAARPSFLATAPPSA